MYQPASIFVSPATAAKPPPRCRQCEQSSRQYDEELSVIMKTEELRGGQRRKVKREAEISIITGQSAKPLEQEKHQI